MGADPRGSGLPLPTRVGDRLAQWFLAGEHFAAAHPRIVARLVAGYRAGAATDELARDNARALGEFATPAGVEYLLFRAGVDLPEGTDASFAQLARFALEEASPTWRLRVRVLLRPAAYGREDYLAHRRPPLAQEHSVGL